MAFTDDWDTDLCSDATDAIQIDDYINKTRTDIEERLKNWVYGFVQGENDGVGGLIFAKFKEQSGDQTTAASVLGLYAKDDSGTCLYARPESNGTAIKLLDANCQIPAGAYAADSIDEDDIRLANNANLTGRNNAGDGDINILKVNTSDGVTMGAVTTLPDTSALATSGAPAADAQIANKKYVDDLIASEVTASAYTDEDSDTNAMLKAHAYLAATDGWVFATDTGLDAGESLSVYVGASDDPAGAGDLIQVQESGGTDRAQSVCALVAEGEYFEVTSDKTPTIRWKSIGTLSKPVDQD